MVVTRGIAFPEIKFALSTLDDKGLTYTNGESFEGVASQWKKYFLDHNVSASSVHFMKQVHGKNFKEVDSGFIETVVPDVDALVTRTPGIFIAVKSADCLPIMLFDAQNKAVAAVHAGWRGTKEMVLQKVLEYFVEQGSKPENMYAILCPCIGACCYNVTESKDGRIEDFQKLFGKNGVKERNNQVFLDIRGANLQILHEFNVLSEHIINMNECTVSGVLNLPSFYKNKTNKRFVSIIGMA